MITPTTNFVIIFPKDDEGNDIKYRFILSIGKKIQSVEQSLIQALGTLDGIDGFNMIGRYTMELTIARTFNPDEVIEELKRRLEEQVLSDIIRPKIVV